LVELSSLQSVYAHEGPFATVYLEGRSPGEDAAHQVRLRWDNLRDQLAGEGADEQVLAALDAHLSDPPAGEVQVDGRVLVATAAGVHLDEPWDAALGSGDAAHWSSVAELGAHVRETARAVRALVAIADQEGAVVRQAVVTEEHAVDERASESVEGSSIEAVHKPRGQALSHRRIQQRAEDAVKQNAQDVVAHLSSVAKKFRPHLLVLAGEAKGRSAINDELSKDLASICVQSDRGGIEDAGAEEALAEQLREFSAGESERRMTARAEEYAEAKAHDRALEGAQEVTRAARMGAVETLLLQPHAHARHEGSLLFAVAQEGGAADVVDTELADGVGAILRFPLPDQDGE
jgi:Bacterial archaeo-eukaryotic release factor family 2